jgi:hypothetical protein
MYSNELHSRFVRLGISQVCLHACTAQHSLLVVVLALCMHVVLNGVLCCFTYRPVKQVAHRMWCMQQS